MEVKDLVERIRDWECEAGESFRDYFMHDRVKTLSWAFWLLGKGFTEHALVIIGGLEKGKTYFDQDTLFNIHDEYELENDHEDPKWSEENYLKNVEIWAEFLTATASYRARVEDFFSEEDEEDED